MAISLRDLTVNDNGGESAELRARRKFERAEMRKNEELSFDEAKVGKGVADYFATKLPGDVKINKSKAPTEFAAVQNAFSDDDPRKELMPVVKENYKTLLRNKDARGVSSEALLDYAYKSTVEGTPSRQVEGQTFADDIHRAYLKDKTSIFGGGKIAEPEGFEDWRQEKILKNRSGKEYVKDVAENIGENALFNTAAVGVAQGARYAAPLVGKALARAGLEKTGEFLASVSPHPAGKLFGMALTGLALAVPQGVASDTLRNSEWYKAREDEPLKQMFSEIGVMVGADAAAFKLAKGTVKEAVTNAVQSGQLTETALSKLTSKGNADAIVELAKARNAEKVAKLELDVSLASFDGAHKDMLANFLENKANGFNAAQADELLGRTTEPKGGLLASLRSDFGKKSSAFGDTEALAGKIQSARDTFRDDILKLTPEGESQFGWAGENTSAPARPTRAVPTVTSVTKPPIDPGGFGKTFGWDGTPNVESAMPIIKRGTTDTFGVSKEISVHPEEISSPSITTKTKPGYGGGGGIFGLADTPSPVKKAKDGSVFGISKIVKELDEDQAAELFTDVTRDGKPLEQTLNRLVKTREVGKALETTEANITKASETMTTIAPTSVSKYEGAEVVTGTKAAKVNVLQSEKIASLNEIANTTKAQEKATKTAAQHLASTVEELMPKEAVDRLPGGKLLADNLTDEQFEEQMGSILSFVGERLRISGTKVPNERSVQIAGLAKPQAEVSTVAKKTIAAESAKADPTKESSVFEKVMRKEVSEADYSKQMADPEFRNLEANRIYNDLAKGGKSLDEIDNHPALKLWRQKFVEPHIKVENEVADDIFGSSDNNPLRGLIPAIAVGSVSVAAALGLPDTSEASTGTAVFNGIKSLPKAWVSTVAAGKAIKSMTKEESHKAMASLIKGMDEAGYVIREAGDSKILPSRGQTPNMAALAKETYGSIGKAVKQTRGLPLGVENIMTPYGRGEVHYATGANPAVHLAMMQTQMNGNIENGLKVLDNIMKDIPGGQSASNEIVAMFQPLAEEYSGVVGAYTMAKTKLKQLEKAEGVLRKAIAGKADEYTPFLQKRLDEHVIPLRNQIQEAINTDMAPKYEEYVRKHAALTKEAARKYPSSRIFLAAEDDAAGSIYPWLHDEKLLSPKEKEAVTYIKAMMKSYEEAAVAQNLNVMTERPFMHHSWHPSWKAEAAAKYLEDTGLDIQSASVPYNQFHSRSYDSLPMVPDVQHSVQSYLPIAERTLGWSGFWNKNGDAASSWYKHMKSPMVQNDRKLRMFWNAVVDSAKPVESTQLDKWASRYANVEVIRLLGANPSVAFKHLFKNIGTAATLGLGNTISHVGDAASTAFRNIAGSAEGKAVFEKLGMQGPSIEKKFWDDAAKSYTRQGRHLSVLDEMGMRPPENAKDFDGILDKVATHSGVMTSMVENYDRIHSFLAATEMAAKSGLTARDANYAVFDTILKNNFLGGALNPAWAKSPLLRGLMLFQTTAFKLAERRMVTAMKAGKAVGEAFSVGKNMDWTWDRVQSEMSAIKDFVIKGEYEFKKSLITDALAADRDFLGQYTSRQAMRELLYAGGVIGGGYALGHDYGSHVFHLPFIKANQDSDPEIGLSPIARAAWDTAHGKKYNGEESDFGIVGDFLNNWFKSQGPLPTMVRKSMDISSGDVPEIYKREGFMPKEFRYFFAIPSNRNKDDE